MQNERNQKPQRTNAALSRNKIPIYWQLKPAPVDEEEEELETTVERIAEANGISVEDAVSYIEQHFEEEERDPVGTQLRMYIWETMN